MRRASLLILLSSGCLALSSCSGVDPDVQASDVITHLRTSAIALVPAPLRVVREVDEPCPDSSAPEIELTVHGAQAQSRLLRSLEQHGWRFDGHWYRGEVAGKEAWANAELGDRDADAMLTVGASGFGDEECSLPTETLSPTP